MAAAAWSWVEKMLQLAQRTEAPKGRQALDQHGRFHGHVQRPGDAHALERLGGGVFAADGHQTRHFVLGDVDGLAAVIGQAEVLDFEVHSAVCVFGGRLRRPLARREEDKFDGA